jgi:hypothetical protein
VTTATRCPVDSLGVKLFDRDGRDITVAFACHPLLDGWLRLELQATPDARIARVELYEGDQIIRQLHPETETMMDGDSILVRREP